MYTYTERIYLSIPTKYISLHWKIKHTYTERKRLIILNEGLNCADRKYLSILKESTYLY